MNTTSIPTLCDEITKNVATLKLQATNLLAHLSELDAEARANLNDPRFDGSIGSLCPTQEARDGLRAFLLDELHLILGVAAPRREIYYVEGRKKVIGPAIGTLADRVFPCIVNLERRIEKARARAAEEASA